jgi:glycosyltransferase involved in cell wall biosynthesis
MSVFNGEKFLADAIESVLAQSFHNFEFLIHDDGSNDSSLKIAQKYAAGDKRISVTTDGNVGLAASLNRLIETSKGEFLARMDADDICMPDRFEKQVGYLDTVADCVAVGGSHIVVDSARRPIFCNVMPQGHDMIDSQNIRGVVSIHHPTVMMRKEAVFLCGGYNSSYDGAEDLDLWLRLAEIGHLANLPDVVLKYRIHGESISGTKRDLQRQMCRRACEAAWQRRGLTEVSFDYQDWRMDDTPASQLEFSLRYGWQAWNSGYRQTWRHYALRSVWMAPLSRDAWALLVAGALKQSPTKPSVQ